MDDFETWWQQHGQFCRAGGGDYEKTFAYRAWQAGQQKALEQAAQAVERHDVAGREWVPTSFWGTLSREAAARVRALAVAAGAAP